MRIALNRDSAQPVYLQIRDRLQHLITSGSLQIGERLPSIRGLARSLQVNKLTILEAYGLLEAEGLILARPGSGYFVAQASLPLVKPSTFAPQQDVIVCETQSRAFYHAYAQSIQAHDDPDIIDLGCSYPSQAPNDLQRICRRVASQAETLMGYASIQGNLTLRQQISQLLIQRGVEVAAESLIITNGSMQGLSLAFQYFLKPGDWVLVESPTFHGALAILEQLEARLIGIPMTATGINLDLLEQYLKSHQPKLIYTISTIHNPTGITTSLTHRQQLLDLAQRYHCPILEDNAYEGLSVHPVPPPLKGLDQQGWVTYLGTFSKTLMPGLRVGYIAAPLQHHKGLSERKLLSDLHTSTVSQAIVSEYLATGHYRRHLHRLQTLYSYHQTIMVQAMETYFPIETSWTIPKGGLYLWVQLPHQINCRQLCNQAAANRVIIVDGNAMFPGQQGYPAIRLAFSNRTPEVIEEGISILGSLLQQALSGSVSILNPVSYTSEQAV